MEETGRTDMLVAWQGVFLGCLWRCRKFEEFQACVERLEDYKANLNQLQRSGLSFTSPGNLTLRWRLGGRRLFRGHSWDRYHWTEGRNRFARQETWSCSVVSVGASASSVGSPAAGMVLQSSSRGVRAPASKRPHWVDAGCSLKAAWPWPGKGIPFVHATPKG